ncbi:MAG: magnesium-translocating P-type ATPase [Gemmatimonadota bacterium]
MPPTPWARSLQDLYADLGTAAEGLSAEEALTRLALHGPNALKPSKRDGVVRIFLRQFSNPLVLILVVAAGIAAGAGEPTNATIILLVLLGSALLTAVQEFRAGNAVEALRSRVVLRARVLREGSTEEIPAEDIVTGDIVLLSAGVLVPADGVLVEARDLYLNQAVLTGESFPVVKEPGEMKASAAPRERTNMVFMGTSVRSGTGRAVVTATARDTAYGAIADRLALRPERTEFELGIRRFGYLLTRVIVVLVVIVFAGNLLLERPAVDALLFSVALAVGISPELLPGIISVNLARGARAMAADGVIVRRLNAIENFGSMNVLCADKTGTLTEGTLRLTGAVDPEGESSPEVHRIALANAHLQTGMQNPLDEAVMASGGASALPSKVDEVPYDFVRRRMTVVVTEGSSARLLAKGAVRELLEVCVGARSAGTEVPITPEMRRRLESRVEAWSAEGLRTLGVATRRLPRQPRYGRESEVEMTFEGFLLFEDRPKAGVEDVLRELRGMGVEVKIITGDNRFVARHVAGQVGLDPDALVTGSELLEMRDEALWRNAAQATVFAEVDPNQKERIILALRRTGHVVGYLGDGINDAPALHSADVGISVDGAADVARESADLVLLRRDLEVLRKGILEGRRTFANTLKYVHITTSANFGNMVSMAAASLFLPFLPLLARQILLNNFLSDIPAIALASDKVDATWVEVPRRWEIGPIQHFMVVFGLVSTFFDFLAFGVLLFVFRAGPELFRTGWFVLSLLTELVILFVARTHGPFWTSRPSLGLVGASLGIAIVGVVLPVLAVGRYFDFVPLPTPLLASLLLLVLGYAVATEAAKRWFYRKPTA